MTAKRDDTTPRLGGSVRDGRRPAIETHADDRQDLRYTDIAGRVRQSHLERQRPAAGVRPADTTTLVE